MTDRETRFERFQAAYTSGEKRPWDSGIVPPEVLALVSEPDAPSPGRALDIGCGTGVSAVYLAGQGWQVTGVDWIARAVELAAARARQAGLTVDQARFVRADITAADFLINHPPVDLWLDIGCLHSLLPEGQSIYARHAARLVRRDGIIRLYAWRSHERDGGTVGLEPDQVGALFAPAFRLESAVLSVDGADPARPAAWYRLRRA